MSDIKRSCLLPVLLSCLIQSASTEICIAQEVVTSSVEAAEESALRAAADAVAPSVVQIRTIGGLDSVDGALLADGPTTGLIVSPDGYIVSSAFNFIRQPTSILVTFASGKQSPAELVATDHSRMLVLLKATAATDLPVAELAPASDTRPGQWGIALGRTFRADKANISVGIISAVNRMFGKVIQTDADVSTANYGGPLVDIHGRVLGVLVPMAPQSNSPQGASEVAGVEWYDSGIGFAVPLAPLADRIELMKKGEDQYPGLLGIGMATKNPHTAKAELSVVRPDGPAGQAGFRKGDRVIELDGRKIKSQTDMRFSLGTKYGGQTVRVVAMRGKERIEGDVKLVGKLPEFEHAFLGILPSRESAADVTKPEDDEGPEDKSAPTADQAKREKTAESANSTSSGVKIRWLYPDSPAIEAGLAVGDRIIEINGSPASDISKSLQILNSVVPGSLVNIKALRDSEAKEFKVTAGRMPTAVPDKIVSADAKAEGSSVPAKSGDTVKLKLPEFENECSIYVPADSDGNEPRALVIFLPADGDANAEDTIQPWQTICYRDGILLAVPGPAENQEWDRTDLEYLRRLSERVVAQYKVDPNRIVAYGEKGGGTLAWMLAYGSRDLFRGLATAASPLPRQLQVPPNEPTQRFAILAAIPADKPAQARIAKGLQKVADSGYRVNALKTLDTAGKLSNDDREEIARWIDTLDRF